MPRTDARMGNKEVVTLRGIHEVAHEHINLKDCEPSMPGVTFVNPEGVDVEEITTLSGLGQDDMAQDDMARVVLSKHGDPPVEAAFLNTDATAGRGQEFVLQTLQNEPSETLKLSEVQWPARR